MTDEQGNFWTLPELLADLDRGEHLYMTPKMCADLAKILREPPYVGGEYLCKCGVRVTPHKCGTGRDF